MASTPTTDLSWLPSDAEEQLSLGFRIISNAYKHRVQSLEAENRSMRVQVDEKSQQFSALQKKHSSLEVELIESHQRGNQLAEENKSLVQTSRKLQKDIQRLESLKQAVLSSIQGDHPEEDTALRLLSSPDYLQQAAPLTMQEITGEAHSPDPLLRYSKPEFMGSPSGSAVEGKQFFRQVRSRLQYDAFNQFLTELKRLNGHQQTREETLGRVRDLLGPTNNDLFDEFSKLLIRHTQI